MMRLELIGSLRRGLDDVLLEGGTGRAMIELKNEERKWRQKMEKKGEVEQVSIFEVKQ